MNAVYTGSLRIKTSYFYPEKIYHFISGAELKWLTVQYMKTYTWRRIGTKACILLSYFLLDVHYYFMNYMAIMFISKIIK